MILPWGRLWSMPSPLAALVAEVEVFDDHQINILRVLVYWVPALFALIFRKRLFSSSGRTENLFVNMSMVSAFILTIGLVRGANLYARMAAYFEIGTAIALPWMFQKLFTRRSAQFVTIAAAALYFGTFCMNFRYQMTLAASYSSD